MGSPALTAPPFDVRRGRDATRMRRTGIWTSVVGVLLTFVGAVTVLVVRDDPGRPSTVGAGNQPPVTATVPGGGPATTAATVPAVNRPPGTIARGPQPVTPAVPIAPPPATPQEVAELLASLPLQLEQAATSDGQPRELPPEEVEKMVEDLLRQLGAQP